MGSISPANWCKSFDGWLPLSKEGWSVEGRCPANQHTFFLIPPPESNSPPLETTPLPLSVSHWRISPSVFDEEEELTAAFTNPGPGKASAGKRIGRNIVPECTGSFHSVPFSRVVLLSFTLASSNKKVKPLFFFTDGEVLGFLWCGL